MYFILIYKCIQKYYNNLPLALVTLRIVLLFDDLMWQIGTSENLTAPKSMFGVFTSGNMSSFLEKKNKTCHLVT